MGTQALTFREMTLADVAAVAELDEKCFGDDSWSGDYFIYELRNKNAAYVVGELDGRIIACAGVKIFLDEAEATTLAVAPEFQGRGFGKKIFAEQIRVAKSRGATSMIFEVRCSNIPAIHIYQKSGFRKIGRIKNYYGSEDALTMRGEI